MDAASPFSKRIEVWASDETCEGFRVHVRTWGDSVTYGVKVSWVASTETSLVHIGTLPLTSEPDGETSQGEESQEHQICFEGALARVPDVACGFARFDARGDEHLRLWTDAEGASAECFALRCGTSESSVAKNVRLSWIASSCPIQLQLGSLQIGSREGGDPIEGGVDRFVDVSFPQAFNGVPGVALALAGFETDARKHARIDTWADGVSELGFRLHVRSWENSVTHSVKVTWFATQNAPNCTTSHLPPHQPPLPYVPDEKPLGQGYWAVTHRASHPLSGGVFAVKTCRHPFKEHEQLLRRELDNLVRLPVHPNLLRYHEFVIQADRLHIVCDYIDAFNFSQLVPGPDGGSDRHNPSLVLTWIAQLCDGLARMHGAGIVHRDLHGENVLVERDADLLPSSGPRAVRIIDFGAAGFNRDTMKPSLMSHEAGHRQYFSPERRKGLAFSDLDDVWAVGCHLTELTSGRLIRNREGCGLNGVDFATTPKAISEAVRLCECGCGRCSALAAMILVPDEDLRPRAGAVRDAVKLALRCMPLRKRKFAGPSGNARSGRQRRRCKSGRQHYLQA